MKAHLGEEAMPFKRKETHLDQEHVVEVAYLFYDSLFAYLFYDSLFAIPRKASLRLE